MKIKALIGITLVSIVLYGCGGQQEIKENETVTIAGTDVKQIEDTIGSTEEETTKNTGASVTQQTIFEQDGIKIAVTGLELDGSFFGSELKLLIENDTDNGITVQARNVSVNGYMVDTSMSVDVASKKKSNDALTFMERSLEERGIEQIAEIDFSFHIFNSDSWDSLIDTEVIHIDTSCAGSYVQSYDDSGEVIYDNNGIRIVAKGILEDSSYMGPSLIVYIENNTEDAITIQSRDVSINGFMVDPIFSCEIMPGKKAIDDITFMNSDIEENQIESIDEVEISFHIFKTDGWDTIQDTDPITVNFK